MVEEGRVELEEGGGQVPAGQLPSHDDARVMHDSPPMCWVHGRQAKPPADLDNARVADALHLGEQREEESQVRLGTPVE
eukprot:CAMPEP_0184249302 /NCGR_PEP_ID=MMETSP0977-20130417/3774_1 /TAXON_ID=483370 /ORGANISM="non described non described, Strain CCMP2097" /LENGTH=78 /DNA_ID=CAMNT_0026554691 /DNA_START=27 /DNA_END=263 /DNA_ORIENTATION=+